MREAETGKTPKPPRLWASVVYYFVFLAFPSLPAEKDLPLEKQHLGNTFGITMKTVALKIPEELDMKIRQAARRGKESFSALARRALIREIEIQETDFARLAAPYRGMFEGPADLSSREGYGDKNPR